MGANAQTSVPTFTAGEVLTAANMNISAGTGVPVFATTTTRDAAFGGTGEKTLAQGQLAYIEATNVVQYYNGTAWATLGPSATPGVELVSSTTIGTAVSSVTVSAAFSSTYDNYLVIISGGTSSVSDSSLVLTLGAKTTGYKSAFLYWDYATSSTNYSFSTVSIGVARTGTDGLQGVFEVVAPNLAKNTTVTARGGNPTYNFICTGVTNDTTQYTAFTLTTGTGTVTGGTIKVYGYKN